MSLTSLILIGLGTCTLVVFLFFHQLHFSGHIIDDRAISVKNMIQSHLPHSINRNYDGKYLCIAIANVNIFILRICKTLRIYLSIYLSIYD